MDISYIVVTKNNERTIEACIKGIRKQNPKNIIVLDANSIDKTKEILKEINCPFFIPKESDKVGFRRYLGAMMADTKWIAYIDSDVELFPNWFKTLEPFINLPNVGTILATDFSKKSNQWIAYSEFLRYRIEKYGVRMLSNTLVRRELVLECTEMKDLNFGEDLILFKHISNKGLKSVVIYQPLSIHYANDMGYPRRYYRAGKDLGSKENPLRWLYWFGKSTYQWLGFIGKNPKQTFDIRVPVFLWFCNLAYLIGSLRVRLGGT